MRDLAGLIKLHRWQLDEKRRALAELEGFAARLAEEKARLDAEYEREREAADGADGPVPGYARWLDSINARRRRLAQSTASVEQQMETARAEMAEAFRELKKVELAQAERDRRDAEKRKRQERISLDEIALSGFRRRQAEAAGAGD
ncbi:MAG: flagellar FliJ family protein [Azospirillaceae bacterium]